MKGEEAKLLRLLWEFWSVKKWIEANTFFFWLHSLEFDGYQKSRDCDISNNDATKVSLNVRMISSYCIRLSKSNHSISPNCSAYVTGMLFQHVRYAMGETGGRFRHV